MLLKLENKDRKTDVVCRVGNSAITVDVFEIHESLAPKKRIKLREGGMPKNSRMGCRHSSSKA